MKKYLFLIPLLLLFATSVLAVVIDTPKIDHIQEETGSHGVVIDNDATILGDLNIDSDTSGLVLGDGQDVTLKWDNPRTDLLVDNDILIEDKHPSVWLIGKDTGYLQAFGLHYHPGEAYEVGFWEGDPSASGIDLTRNTPLWGFDANRLFWLYDGNAEVATTVQHNVIKRIAMSVDPGAWYDSDAEIFLVDIGDDAPDGIIIDEWKTSCQINNPSPEVAAELRYADAWIGLANSVLIDTLTTSSGVSSEDTDSNINSGNPIPNGKVIYILFTSDPEGTATQWHVDIWYHLAGTAG